MSDEVTPTKSARVMLGDLDWIKVHKLLTEHLKVISGTNDRTIVDYDEGWSDKRIAEEVGGTATENNVLYRREKHFGKLLPKVITAASDPRVDKLQDEVVLQDALIQELSKKVDNLGQLNTVSEIADLKDHYNRLIAALKMAHIGDFRGLMFEEG